VVHFFWRQVTSRACALQPGFSISYGFHIPVVQTRLGARRSVVQTTSNLLGHAPSSLDNMVAFLDLANNTGIVDYCPFFD
jgi:hypothetical protein